MKDTKEFIEKAIEGNYCGITGKGRNIVFETNLSELLLDPKFWQAVGKVEGWGDWDKKFEDVEHDWKLIHYLADTGKTPVYYCKKCFAEKINNIVKIEIECGDGDYIEAGEIPWTRRNILSKHANYKKGYKEKMLAMTQALIDGKTIEQFISTL